MSYCPNCAQAISSDASACSRCGALFDGGGWGPQAIVPKQHRLVGPDKRSVLEKSLDAVAVIGLVLGPVSCGFAPLLPAGTAVVYAFIGVPLLVAAGVGAALARLLLYLLNRFLGQKVPNEA